MTQAPCYWSETGFGEFFFGLLRKTAGAVYPSQLSIVHVSCVEGTQTTSSVLIPPYDWTDKLKILATLQKPSCQSLPHFSQSQFPNSQFGF